MEREKGGTHNTHSLTSWALFERMPADHHILCVVCTIHTNSNMLLCPSCLPSRHLLQDMAVFLPFPPFSTHISCQCKISVASSSSLLFSYSFSSLHIGFNSIHNIYNIVHSSLFNYSFSKKNSVPV
jgi:hypothetical protein